MSNDYNISEGRERGEHIVETAVRTPVIIPTIEIPAINTGDTDARDEVLRGTESLDYIPGHATLAVVASGIVPALGGTVGVVFSILTPIFAYASAMSMAEAAKAGFLNYADEHDAERYKQAVVVRYVGTFVLGLVMAGIDGIRPPDLHNLPPLSTQLALFSMVGLNVISLAYEHYLVEKTRENVRLGKAPRL